MRERISFIESERERMRLERKEPSMVFWIVIAIILWVLFF